MGRYSISSNIPYAHDEALRKTKEALHREGFGVLSEINMTDAVKSALDRDLKKYHILGIFSFESAYRALTIETEIGLLMPCNIIVYENEKGSSTVAAVDPVMAMSMAENPALALIARDAKVRLERVIKGLA